MWSIVCIDVNMLGRRGQTIWKHALLALIIYSVVFVDHNLADDGIGNHYDNDEDIVVYDQISDYQQCQMEYIHDVSPDSCMFENAVPILDQHVSLSES